MGTSKLTARYSLEDLVYLMQRLRDPVDGCPWDLKQDYLSITPSTIEEAYEVVDTIEKGDFAHLKEELGDLLFQAIFYSQLASEEGRFTFADVVDSITAKLLRRHPHVFPDGTLESRRPRGQELDESEVKTSWEAIKQVERESKGSPGVFDDIPSALPGLTRAAKLQKRAAKAGFDWSDKKEVFEKVEEEVAELRDALTREHDRDIAAELADLMFTCVNLARHIGKEPESLVRQANEKFERRFQSVFSQMRASDKAEHSASELEVFWQKAKNDEVT